MDAMAMTGICYVEGHEHVFAEEIHLLPHVAEETADLCRQMENMCWANPFEEPIRFKRIAEIRICTSNKMPLRRNIGEFMEDCAYTGANQTRATGDKDSHVHDDRDI